MIGCLPPPPQCRLVLWVWLWWLALHRQPGQDTPSPGPSSQKSPVAALSWVRAERERMGGVTVACFSPPTLLPEPLIFISQCCWAQESGFAQEGGWSGRGWSRARRACLPSRLRRNPQELRTWALIWISVGGFHARMFSLSGLQFCKWHSCLGASCAFNEESSCWFGQPACFSVLETQHACTVTHFRASCNSHSRTGGGQGGPRFAPIALSSPLPVSSLWLGASQCDLLWPAGRSQAWAVEV